MADQRKNIAILGSTGTIGVKGVKIALENPDRFKICGLAAGNNINTLAGQIKALEPDLVSVGDQKSAENLRKLIPGQKTELVWGPEGLIRVAEMAETDLVLSAVSGFAGLAPTLAAARAGKVIALSNKESLVAGGDLVMSAAKTSGASILPVDSEHSAIFQALRGDKRSSLKKIILTASGGPFLNKSSEELESVTPAQALDHPNWDMGAKVTIDSATLMNKGLEMIEAVRLFHVSPSEIEIVIHPQSIIHSAVEYVDGSVLAQMSTPDMALPIAYAMAFPDRIPVQGPERLDLIRLGSLTFQAPDLTRFPNLRLAYEAAKAGGTAPAVLNGADEVAVQAFLDGRIGFMAIPLIIERVLDKHKTGEVDSLEAAVQADAWARREATRISESIEAL